MDEPVIVEQLIQASPEDVWAAITQKEHMRQWYFDVSDFEAKEGFTFSFRGDDPKGEKYIHHCRVTEAVPQEKLQYTWTYEGYEGESIVTFTIEARGSHSLIQVKHEGIENFPSSNPDLSKNNFKEGWTYILQTALKNYLEKDRS